MGQIISEKTESVQNDITGNAGYTRFESYLFIGKVN